MSKPSLSLRQVRTTDHLATISEHLQNAISAVESNAQELSIVLFRIADPAKRGELSSLLTTDIQDQIRVSDSIGWLDTDHLAFVLPETGSDGAADLLRRLAEATGISEAVEDYWVISYPRCTCVPDAILDYARLPRRQ